MKRIIIVLSILVMSFISVLSPHANAQVQSKSEQQIFNEVKYYLPQNIPGFSLLETPEKPIKAKIIEISQVLSSDCKIALAYANPKNNDLSVLYGTQVLVLSFEKYQFYDDQIIKIPSKHKVIPIGRYKYTTVKGIQRTVPAVIITTLPPKNKNNNE